MKYSLKTLPKNLEKQKPITTNIHQYYSILANNNQYPGDKKKIYFWTF